MDTLIPSQCPIHEQVAVVVGVADVVVVVVATLVVVVRVVEPPEDKRPRLLERAETNESPISRKVLKLVI